MDTPIFSRTARGYWAAHASLDVAVALHRKIGGDRRGKTELWKLVEGCWLYVGPRPRRGTTRHIAHFMTENGATLIGFLIPDTARAAARRVAC
jgi:hypothetical protein